VTGDLIKILTVAGTRPEMIKLAPVVQAAEANARIDHHLCVTAQHRQMLDQVMEIFGLTAAHDLNIMQTSQTLDTVVANVVGGVGAILDAMRPDWVIVQGDTSTAFGAALAAYHRRIRVAHVEAGLRTGDLYSPWPEEGNRRLIGQLAALHFPPTSISQDNLLRENVSADRVLVTGNTVIDALHLGIGKIADDAALKAKLDGQFSYLSDDKRLILVTGHRRENFDGGLERVCRVLAEISDRGDVEIVYPVHLNPQVQEAARRVLGGRASVHLIEPQDYRTFLYLMDRAYLIVTDSGGIQEEAPALGTPVLVTRDTTERPEAIAAGTARLLGTSAEALRAAILELLDDSHSYDAMARAANPFGDGRAAERIINRILQEHRT
jgi:UDP-N-acetylglucosamine 2-epimerase